MVSSPPVHCWTFLKTQNFRYFDKCERWLVDFMCSVCRGSSMGLTLFMLSLFFASRADLCCVNNHISNMISLNVELLKSAVIWVFTIRPALMHIWVDTCTQPYKSVLILTEQISAACQSKYYSVREEDSAKNKTCKWLLHRHATVLHSIIIPYTSWMGMSMNDSKEPSYMTIPIPRPDLRSLILQ